MLHLKYYELLKQQEALLTKKNEKNHLFYNGVYYRFINPVLTRHHVPIDWRYDLDLQQNPFFMERLGINATFNAGAIYYEQDYYLIVRVEGTDRKSFFALAKSHNGVDNFRFVEYPIDWNDIDENEVNMYDMRLVKHEDGYIYGIYCSESKDIEVSPEDTTSAIAKAGLVRTKDLKKWERLPNISTPSLQQRNVVLHPEFVGGKYAFYTRPQEGFISTGKGGGIAFGICEDITNPIIKTEKVIDSKKYHTISELKNGQGPAPIKTDRGWIHFAHGVRNTAAGLRYVLYTFATSLDDPSKIIAKPGGYFLAPFGIERIGDVSNVVFCNGVIANENKDIFIYYSSSDTRIHVATTTVDRIIDYTFNTPVDSSRSLDSAKKRKQLILKNEEKRRYNEHI